MALQCQVKDAFSTTQNKSEAMKVQALTTVCAGEWSSMLNIVSCVNNFAAISFFFFPLSNYLILCYWTTWRPFFLWKTPNGDLEFFSILSTEQTLCCVFWTPLPPCNVAKKDLLHSSGYNTITRVQHCFRGRETLINKGLFSWLIFIVWYANFEEKYLMFSNNFALDCSFTRKIQESPVGCEGIQSVIK